MQFKHYFLCIISGIITAISFKEEYFAPLIFFSLIPYLYCILKSETRRSIYCSTLAFYLSYSIIVFSWIEEIRTQIDAKEPLPTIIILISLFTMAIVSTFRIIIAVLFYSRVKTNKFADIYIFSFLFIVGELFQEILTLFPFPWARVGVIATPIATFIQSASVFGSLFITFLILIINGTIAYAIINYKEKTKVYSAISVALILVIVNLSYGIITCNDISSKTGKTLDVCVVQGNFAGTNKWNITSKELTEYYISLSQSNMTNETDIVFWPETAIPTILNNSDITNQISDFSKQKNIDLVTGAFFTSSSNNEFKTYNSMFISDNEGRIRNVYSKQFLVPFGETVPFYEQIKKIPSIRDVFSKRILCVPGENNTYISNSSGNFGGIICYESIFPIVARKQSYAGAEYLVVISNDSWFGDSQAIYQHFQHSRMRAVENQKSLVRCANTAITAIIDKNGNVIKSAPHNISTALNDKIYLSNKTSFYTKYPNIICIPGLFLWVLGLSKYLYEKRQKLKK